MSGGHTAAGQPCSGHWQPHGMQRMLPSKEAHLGQVGDAQHEADGVQDVGFATAVEAGDGIEVSVKAWHRDALSIGLETINADLLNEHGCLVVTVVGNVLQDQPDIVVRDAAKALGLQ